MSKEALAEFKAVLDARDDLTPKLKYDFYLLRMRLLGIDEPLPPEYEEFHRRSIVCGSHEANERLKDGFIYLGGAAIQRDVLLKHMELPEDVSQWLHSALRTAKTLANNTEGREVLIAEIGNAQEHWQGGSPEKLKICMYNIQSLWRELNVAKRVEMADNFSYIQSEKGKKRWADRADINNIIIMLAMLTDAMGDGLPNKALWSLFHSELESMRFDPQDSSGEKPKDSDCMSWDCDKGKREEMTYKTFKNRVSDERAKLKKSSR